MRTIRNTFIQPSIQLNARGFGVSRAVLAFFAVLLLWQCVGMSTVMAGTWYQTNEAGYWLYVDGQPQYEVMLPSNAAGYLETAWSGSTLLQVTLQSEGVPMIVAGEVPKTDPKVVFDAVTRPWALALRDIKITQDQTITTETGLKPRFMVMTGTGPDGYVGLVRMVAFSNDETTVYLLFIGEEKHYDGTPRQQWLKAVHSFDWT